MKISHSIGSLPAHALGLALALGVAGVGASAPDHDDKGRHEKLEHIKHIVVIYQENHSFDNLFGEWEGVDGLKDADIWHTQQVTKGGALYGCLLQNDVNLTSPSPLATTCTDTVNGIVASAFSNAPFRIDSYIVSTDTTCPAPGAFATNGLLKGAGLAGGCTRDLVHRYYQEQYQIDGGRQDRYMTGSDAVGLSMGFFSTRDLPIYKYLHTPGHPHYAIADRFFQSAFGGSFLNHQWLIAAKSPVWAGALNDGSSDDLHSTLDANGMPNQYALYQLPAGWTVKDQQLTQSCAPAATRAPKQAAFACGDFAVNTSQPFYQPYSPGTALTRRLPLLTHDTIGDRLSAANIDWAWYSGGWSNADGRVGEIGWTNGAGTACADTNTASGATWPNCPNKLFQYHHQAFNYFAKFAPGTAARTAHLRDEQEFLQLANDSTKSCKLKPVSFIKPVGAENEHPGYASESNGSSHLVNVIDAIVKSECGEDTMIIVTYDEFGGAWDHVPPPGQGNNDGPHDIWGPGTRIPALVVAPHLKGDAVVDHTSHDTTSILATIERRFHLAPLGTRDAQVEDLGSVFEAHKLRRDRDRDDD